MGKRLNPGNFIYKEKFKKQLQNKMFSQTLQNVAINISCELYNICIPVNKWQDHNEIK